MIFKPRHRNTHKQIICVQQLVDNSKIDKPVPLDKQLPGFLYCDKCLWKTKDKGYYRKHMTWLCKALKSQQLPKCKYCGKMFRHESTLHQHLQVHDGIKRYKCQRCGEMFRLPRKLLLHRKECGK